MSEQNELILNTFYKTFITLENPKDFFYGLADYVDFIKETKEFNQILVDLLNQYRAVEKNLGDLELIAIKKLAEIHKELCDYVSKNKIENGTIKEAFRTYDGYIAGSIMGGSKAQGIQDELTDIIMWLYDKPEHKEFAMKFIIFSEGKTYVRHYLYPEEYKEFYESMQDEKAAYKGELWGQMNEVIRHYQIIKTGREHKKELVKKMFDKNDFKATFELTSSHMFLLGEWTSIEEGKYNKLSFFKIENFRPTIVRFQNHILKVLNRTKNEQAEVLQGLNDMENEAFGIKKTKKEKSQEYQKILDGFQKEIDTIEDFSIESKKQFLMELIKNPNPIKPETKPTKADNAGKPEKKKTEKIILHLGKRGELYQDAINKNCYPIEETSDRHKIVRYFSEKEVYDYYPTQQIANDLELTTKELMKKIGEINNAVIGKLKIKDKILESKKGSGYKINYKYKIVADK